MDEPRTVSKTTYNCLTLAIMMAIAIGTGIATAVLARRTGWDLKSWSSGLGILYVVLGRLAADRLLKMMGLSRSGKSSEVQSRSVAHPEGFVAPGEVVEVRVSRGLARFLLGSCLVMSAFFAVMLLYGPPLVNRFVAVAGAAMAGVFGIYAIAMIADWGTPHAKADDSGVTAYPSPNAVRRRFVPWSEVAACEIETFYDTFGKPVLIRPILLDGRGGRLMAISLLFTKPEDQERLVKYIKARLPKPKTDPWEL